MPYLFDTNALSEVLRRQPNRRFVEWLRGLSAERQFTSSLVVAELYVVAHRMKSSHRWIDRIENAILPVVEVIHFDLECAKVYGQIQGQLMDLGEPIDAVDAQIAATALCYGLTLVTANRRSFERIPDLRLLILQPGRAGELNWSTGTAPSSRGG